MMDRAMLAALRPAWPSAAILVLAALAAWLGPPLPPGLSGLRQAGPYAVLLAAAVVSAWFNRGRAFVLALSLFVAFFARSQDNSAVSAAAVMLVVPLNVAAALLLAERGARFGRAWPWLGLVAAEIFLVLLLERSAMAERTAASALVPHAGRVLFAMAFALSVWRAWPTFSPIETAIPAALVAFFIACSHVGSPGTFALFMAAGGLVLLLAVLHESHRMAFRDGLTGLPNRRALEEQLRALGERYAVAMVDVDHFKAFNDTHGHDVGDQVLRLVAARLAEVPGGGHAFRYGGEEFTVLFPDQRLKDALPHLEAVRGAIERYRMSLRSEDRPKDGEEGARRRASRPAEKVLSVTVSIGVAEPGKGHATPQQVVLAADEALYRAKKAGRNRVAH